MDVYFYVVLYVLNIKGELREDFEFISGLLFGKESKVEGIEFLEEGGVYRIRVGCIFLW